MRALDHLTGIVFIFTGLVIKSLLISIILPDEP